MIDYIILEQHLNPILHRCGGGCGVVGVGVVGAGVGGVVGVGGGGVGGVGAGVVGVVGGGGGLGIFIAIISFVE